MIKEVGVHEFAKIIGLNVLSGTEEQKMKLYSTDVNRAGLQLAGFFDYFPNERVQIIGNVESYYLKTLTEEERRRVFDTYFEFDFPCVVFAHASEPTEYFMQKAIEKGCPVFKTQEATSRVIQKLSSYLQNLLAEYITSHGVLMDVYGVGMLLVGNSGIGKSETALELVKRGHRLVADDAVLIKKVSNVRLTGEAPEKIRYFMEIRGVGIVDVRSIYGIGAVMERKSIDLVILMEPWVEGAEYERLGMDTKYYDILGVKLPMLTIPIRPGRNLAIIMEVAARNYRLKTTGYNPAEALMNNVTRKSED